MFFIIPPLHLEGCSVSVKGFKFSLFLFMLVMVAAITLISGCEENGEARINESEEAADNEVLGEYSPEGGQKFYGDETVSWWPSGDCAVVQDGHWEVSVTFGENGVPEKLETGDAYYLDARVDGDPKERTEFAYASGGGAVSEEPAVDN